MSHRLNSRIALALAAAGLIGFGVVGDMSRSDVAVAATGINQQINFQGRLLNAAGAVVADGTYNMRFKIYCDGDGVLGGTDPGSCTAHASNEHLLWTETHQNSASQGVVVKNGYFSVQLGAITSLSSVDFNQTTLWLSMDVTTNGTDTGGSPTYNGEMTPFKRLSSATYAMNALQLQGMSASAFAQLAANQTFSGTNTFSNTLTATGTMLIQGTTTSTSSFNIKSPVSGSNGNIFTVDTVNGRVGINLGSTNLPASTLEINGTLRLSNSATENFTTPLGTNVNTKINVPIFNPGAFGQIIAFGLPSSADDTARALSLFDARTVRHQPTVGVLSPDESSLVGLSWDGSNSLAVLKTTDENNSTEALTVRSGEAAGTGQTTGAVSVRSGDGVGTNTSSGTVTVDSGSKTGSGTTGSITIGGTNASGINIGNTSITTAVTGNLTVTSPTTTGNALAVTASSLSSGVVFKTTSTNNSAANTAWSANLFNVTNSQATTAVSTGQIAGLNVQFTQNASVAGNSETVANLAVAANSSSVTDNTVSSILNIANNDTSTGNQINVTDGIKIGSAGGTASMVNGIEIDGGSSAVTNGIKFSNIFGGNLIDSTYFTLSQGGNVSMAGNMSLTSGSLNVTALAIGGFTAATISTGSNSNLGLVIQGASGQSADLMQVKDVNGINFIRVDALGNDERLGSINTPYGGIGTYGNLLINSEQLDLSGGSPPWTPGGVASVTADFTTAPDGTTSAERFTGVGNTTLSQTYTTSTAGTYTFSIWLKQSSGAAGTALCIFASGGATPNSCGSATVVNPSTNGWQRYSATVTVSGTTTAVTARLFPGNGSSATIFAWGAQLVLASSPGVYTRTGATSTPQNLGVVANGSFQINATNGQSTDLLRVVDGAGNFAIKVYPAGTIADFTKPTTTGATGAMELGSSATQSSNDINGVIGFLGSGVKHAQIAYAVGDGFYLCDSSAGSSSGDFGQCSSRVNLYGSAGNFNGGLTASGTVTLSSLGTSGPLYVSSGVVSSEANLNVTRGGTGFGSYTSGDLLYASGTSALSKLAVGSNGNCLIVSSNLPAWGSCGSGGLVQVPASTAANTVTPTANSVVGLTVNATSGTAAVGVDINQTQAASAVTIDVSNGTGTVPAGVAVAKTGAGTMTSGVDISNATGTTTNGININNSSGTMTNGISFVGTIGTDISRASGTLTIQGASTGVQTAAAGTVSIGTANNSAITTGTGLFTQGGNLTFNGTSARTITGPSTGGMTLTVASGPLTLSTTTSGALAVTSAGTLSLTGTGITAKPTSDVATALVVSNAGATVNALTVDTETSTDPMKVQVGDTSTSNAPVLLVVDQEDTDPTGTNGAMYYNTVGNTFRCYENGIWTDCITNAHSTFHVYTDFPVNPAHSGDSNEDWFDTSTATTGDADFIPSFGEPGHPYVFRLSTGTATNGGYWYASHWAGIVFSTTELWTYSTQVRVSALSDATNVYTIRTGFLDDQSGSEPTNGCFFKYTHSLSSGHWQGTCRNTGINNGTCDTGVTPTLAASGWDELRIEVTSVAKFYVNDTLGCTISTTNMIPTTTNHNFGFGSLINKGGSTTSRYMDIDYMEVVGRLSSRR